MIHLIGSYYMTAGKNAYTVGEVEESRTKRVFKPGARYLLYPCACRGRNRRNRTARQNRSWRDHHAA